MESIKGMFANVMNEVLQCEIEEKSWLVLVLESLICCAGHNISLILSNVLPLAPVIRRNLLSS